MQIKTVYASNAHVEDLARIGYEAFRDVSVRHGVVPDFPSADLAKQVYKMLIDRSDYYGVVAMVDGKPVGSNFLSISDPVSGVGPLSIDPAYQGMGIGRTLMNDVMGFAQRHGIREVRLLQDAHNVASLALYTSLGFQVRDMIALITTVASGKPDHSIRPAKSTDLPIIDALSKSLYRTSRRNEVIMAMHYGFPAFIRERNGAATGYLVPGLVGHGASQTEDDAISLVLEAARVVPPVFAKLLCPLRYSGLMRSLLETGGKIEKTLTYMTIGPYEYPEGICTPSAGY